MFVGLIAADFLQRAVHLIVLKVFIKNVANLYGSGTVAIKFPGENSFTQNQTSGMRSSTGYGVQIASDKMKVKMRFSIICFAVSLALGLLSMGLLGQILYYIVSPVLNLIFPPMKLWTGDWVWPALIYASVLWPFGFFISGYSHLLLTKLGWAKIALYGVYVWILVMWDLLLWVLMLELLPKPKFS